MVKREPYLNNNKKNEERRKPEENERKEGEKDWRKGKGREGE